MTEQDRRDTADLPGQGPSFDMGSAIAASAQRVAVRHWQGVPWYVAWVKIPMTGQPTPRYRVASLTEDGFAGWQVRTIGQVGALLVQLWGIDPTHSGEVWADWTPMYLPLEQIIGAIRWQDL